MQLQKSSIVNNNKETSIATLPRNIKKKTNFNSIFFSFRSVFFHKKKEEVAHFYFCRSDVCSPYE
jgi:hypothetical protein